MMENKPYVPSPRHIPEWNGLRVLLVFIVAWYHFWQQSWLTPRIGSYSLDYLVRAGYMPVDGTILLSGLLLFLPYARSMILSEPVPDRRSFYRRRVMRIVPSFYFITLLLLFAVALPYGLYYSAQTMVKDLFMHFTFTFTFDPYTYMSTPVDVASWTLAIEMQAYLLFPFLAKAAMRKPLSTLLAMTGISWLWRAYCLWAFNDFGMVVNQLPSFLDVYALGMAAALLYVKLTQLWQKVKRPLIPEIIATLLLIPIFLGLERVMRMQAYCGNSMNIQAGQMIHRFPFALLLALLALALPFAVRPIRMLFGNRVMGFLAGISMNYYLIHQNLAVHLKRLGFPPSLSDAPNRAGEQPWQNQYTALCFGLSFILAVLITYLIEKPGARLLKRLFDSRDAHRMAKIQPAVQAAASQVQPGDMVLLDGLSQEAQQAFIQTMDGPVIVVTQQNNTLKTARRS